MIWNYLQLATIPSNNGGSQWQSYRELYLLIDWSNNEHCTRQSALSLIISFTNIQSSLFLSTHEQSMWIFSHVSLKRWQRREQSLTRVSCALSGFNWVSVKEFLSQLIAISQKSQQKLWMVVKSSNNFSCFPGWGHDGGCWSLFLFTFFICFSEPPSSQP